MTEVISIKENVRNRYKELFDTSLDLIYVLDVNGNFLDANDIALNTLGYKKEEIPSITFKDLIEPEQMEKAFRDLEEIIESGRNKEHNEYIIKKKNGESIFIETYGIPIKEDGKLYAILGIANDITAKKKAEQKLKDSEERFRSLVEATSDWIWEVDQNACYNYTSPKVKELLGYDPEEIIGKTPFDLMPPDEAVRIGEIFQSIKESKESFVGLENENIHKNGQIVMLETSGVPILDEKGSLMGYRGIDREITKRKMAEQRLTESESILKKMVRELNCLYSISTIIDIPEISIDEIIESILELIPHACQFPASTCARIIYDNKNYVTDDFKETEWKFSTQVIINEKPLKISVYSLENIPFLKSELDLIKEIGNRLRIIIEQKDSKQKLKDSEEKYRSILENIKEGYFEVDLKGNFTLVNNFLCETMGYTNEEAMKLNFQAICDEETAKNLFKIYNTVYVTEKDNLHFEYDGIKKNGERINIETSVYLRRDSEGKKNGFFGLARDISERKRAEGKLKESEEKYRLISEKANDLIATLNEKFEYDYINENVHKKIMGYSNEDLIGKSSLDFLHPDDIEYGVKKLRKGFLEGEGIAEMRIKHKDGRYRWFEIRGTTFINVDGKRKGILISRDINERKIAEKLLKESEKKYRVISENAYDMITVLNEKFEYEYINEATHKNVLGYSKEDLLGRSAIDKVHPDDARGVAKKWRKGLKTGEESGVLRYKKKDGTYIWLEVRGKLFKDSDGIFKGILIARDINKRKIAEEKLKESEEKYRSILENMREGYVEVDLKGNFTFVNERVSEYLGYSKDELLSMKVHQIIAHAYIDDILESINKLYKQEVDQLLFDFEAINKVGPRKFLEASVYVKYDSLGKKVGFFGMYRDITEKKEAEGLIKREREKLIELDLLKRDLTTQLSEKLKYPISVISDVSEVLLESYQDRLDANAQRLIELIRDGGEKSANMIERILDISKIESDRFELNKRVENLNEIVNESIHRAYEDLDLHDVGINLRSSEDLFSEVDKIRFKQIFEYYLTNSLRTIPKKGELSILLKEENNYAEIQIKSSGIELKYDEFPFEIQYSDEIMKLHQGSIIREFNREEKSRNIIIRLPIISWFNQLIHIFVIYRTGVLLYDHAFVQEREKSDALIISGGMIGVMSILKEIIKGAEEIRTIDHGDRKVMFELNKTEDVVFALLVKEENPVIRRKLNALIKDFQEYFKEKIKDIHHSSMRSNEWREVSGLIKKHFKFQD